MTYNHYHVQKLLKEQGVINSLIELLNIVNVDLIEKVLGESYESIEERLKIQGILKMIRKFSPDVNMGELQHIEIDPWLLKKIVNTAMKILRNCCKFNTENSIYLFNHI